MASPAVACSTANCFAVAIPPSGYAGVPQGGMRPPLRSVRCLPVVASLPGGDLHLHSPPIRSAPYLPWSVEFGSGKGPLVYQMGKRRCLVQEKGLWCTKWGNGGVWYRRRASGVPIGGEILRYVRMTYGEEIGDGAWKTRGRPWPRERVDGACARRDGAKRKVFQVPPPISGIARTGTSVGDVRG